MPRFAEDERFGKARDDRPLDPFHDSTSIAKEPPRLDVARRAERAAEKEHENVTDEKDQASR
jgi:hypothetical protein